MTHCEGGNHFIYGAWAMIRGSKSEFFFLSSWLAGAQSAAISSSHGQRLQGTCGAEKKKQKLCHPAGRA